MKVTKEMTPNRTRMSNLGVWTAPTISLTSRLARNHCTLIPCSIYVPVYSCSPRPTFEDDTPFLPQKGNTAFIPTSHLGTTRSPMRGARVRHAASHPPPAIIRPSPSNQPVHDPSHSISAVDLDHDADCESDGNATDDEYVPSPALGPRKRRCASSAARKHPTKPSVARGLPSTSQSRPTKRARVPPPSRNKQATSAAVIELAATSKDPTFICPECGWNQTNQRLPDFRRHLLTHTRSSEDADKGWWCKGVLVKDAAQHGIPKTAEQYLFRDKWRVGGCLRTFSRRDALKRHLDNSNVSCVGRPCEAADES
jgi:hypothetical protein